MRDHNIAHCFLSNLLQGRNTSLCFLNLRLCLRFLDFSFRFDFCRFDLRLFHFFLCLLSCRLGLCGRLLVALQSRFGLFGHTTCAYWCLRNCLISCCLSFLLFHLLFCLRFRLLRLLLLRILHLHCLLAHLLGCLLFDLSSLFGKLLSSFRVEHNSRLRSLCWLRCPLCFCLLCSCGCSNFGSLSCSCSCHQGCCSLSGSLFRCRYCSSGDFGSGLGRCLRCRLGLGCTIETSRSYQGAADRSFRLSRSAPCSKVHLVRICS